MMTTNNHNNYIALRKQFPVFTYHDFSMEQKPGNLSIKYHFSAGTSYQFRPALVFKTGDHGHQLEITKHIENVAFHLGMVEMLSYWKAFCSPQIVIEAGLLDHFQMNWWKKLYLWGLGEFFYTNGIPLPADLVEFHCSGKGFDSTGITSLDQEKLIVPVGGGKDSAVCMELLKQSGKQIIPYVVNPRLATNQVLDAAGFNPKNGIVLNREIDPLLLELNKQGFLNGHTPFSAMLAFSSSLAAMLSGTRHIALANESSASEPSVPGSKINHQYSKSLEFENDFRQYATSFLHKDLNYFSLLRPLNELQISALFSTYGAYHDVFKSCNVGSKQDIWCCQCPKCLFTWIMLAPFMEKTRLQKIFGSDLSADGSLNDTLDKLTGLESIKPFECVGTLEEVNVAMAHITRKLVENHEPLPDLMAHYHQTSKYEEYSATDLRELLLAFDTCHCLQKEFLPLMDKARSVIAETITPWI